MAFPRTFTAPGNVQIPDTSGRRQHVLVKSTNTADVSRLEVSPDAGSTWIDVTPADKTTLTGTMFILETAQEFLYRIASLGTGNFSIYTTAA